MFLKSLFNYRSDAPVIDMEPIQTATISFEWSVKPPVSSCGGCTGLPTMEVAEATPSAPRPPALCSDAQQSAVLPIECEHSARINDYTSAEKEARALRIVRNAPDWMTSTDVQLGEIFHVHASTVSRWRKAWVEQGLVKTKRVKRRVWMIGVKS